jgi:hypothetical protein
MAVPRPGQPADVVAEQVGNDLVHCPGTDRGGQLPLGCCQVAQQHQQRRPDLPVQRPEVARGTQDAGLDHRSILTGIPYGCLGLP